MAEADGFHGLSLRGIALDIRDHWMVVWTAAALGAIAALVALWIVTPGYHAATLVGPTTRFGPSGMSPALPPGSGGAGRLLVEPGPGEMLSDFQRYLQLLHAPVLAERLLADRQLVAGAFPDEWDGEAGTFRPPSGAWSWARRQVLRLAGREDWSPPDAVRLATHLRRHLSIDLQGAGPLRRLSYKHPDRAFALMLLNRVHHAAESLIREEAGRRVVAEIGYIRLRLQEVAVAEHRRALTDLLGEQERTRMMIDIDLPVAADMISPPSASSLPDWPDPLVVLPFGAAAGAAIGLLALYGRAVWALPLR